MKKEITNLTVLFLIGLMSFYPYTDSFAACPQGEGTNSMGWKIIYFGTLSTSPGSSQDGTIANPITDYNNANGGLIDGINDCGGNVEVRFLECYYDTDFDNGDINYTTAPTVDNVIFDGQGARMINMSAGSAFLRILKLNNWTLKNFTFQGWNGVDGAVLGLYGATNVTLENVVFDSSPTATAVHIDNADAFDGFNDASVTINDCTFSNNPPVSETVSTGALEIEYTSSGTHTIVEHNTLQINNLIVTLFSKKPCIIANKRSTCP